MSTIEHTVSSDVTKIPLIRRISEIMDEKGDDYSIRKFSTRLAMSRETFRLIMVGERHVTPSEIEDIAKGFEISVERLKQMDTLKKHQELDVLLKAEKRTKSMLRRAYEIATELVEFAIGATECGFSLNSLGKVQYLRRQYDDAHNCWERALEYAKKLQDRFDDNHLLYLVTGNLMLTYTIRREYSNIEEMLHTVESAFPNDPKVLGTGFYTRMKIQEDRGNLELAKDHAYRSLDYFQKTCDNKQIGHGLINIAHCEYLLGNYETSAHALSRAIDILASYENILILAVKEYAKSLMQLKDYQEVIRLVKKYSSLAIEYPDYWGKLQIMYTRATDDPSFAEAVTDDPSISLSVRYYACKSLMEFYTLKRDFESVVRYYDKSRIFSNTKSEYLNEGGF